MEPYLYHGIKFYSIETLYKIIESGFIMPRCMMETPSEDKNNIFNGTKYISLSQKSEIDPRFNDEYRNAFDEFIFEKLCIVIDSIDNPIHPNLVDWDYLSTEEQQKILFNDSDERRSYYSRIKTYTNKKCTTLNGMIINKY